MPLCAIAVGRGAKGQIDEPEGLVNSSSGGGASRSTYNAHEDGHGPSSPSAAGSTLELETPGIGGQQQRDGLPTSTGSGEAQWYAIQEEHAARHPAPLPPPPPPPRATPPRGHASKTGSRGKRGSPKGAKAAKSNPTIGKSTLDAMLAEKRAEAAAEKRGSMFAGDAARASEAAMLDEAAASGEEEGGAGGRFNLGRRWRKRVTFVARTVQIWAFLFHVLLKLLRQKLVQRDEERMSARRRKLGRYLCKAFLKLGPTFIKIGQV